MYQDRSCDGWPQDSKLWNNRNFYISHLLPVTSTIAMLPVSAMSAMMAMIVVHNGHSRENVSQFQDLWNKNVVDYVFYGDVGFDTT